MARRRLARIAALVVCLLSPFGSRVACAAEAPAPIDDIVSVPMSPEESRRAIVVRPGFKVELVAHEPLIVDPVAFAWDAQARLWVVEMNDYPLGVPPFDKDGHGRPGGRVKILTDDDGDGRYDRASVFLEGLKFPTAVLPWRDGALVCAVPEIFFARDTDGDGRADERRPLYTGLHVGNPQHLANGLRFGLDGWVHCANGATRTEVKSVATGKSVDVGTRDFRIHPDTGDIEPLYGRSQYLRECDDWGNWFGNANSNPLYHFALEEQYLRRNPHAVFAQTATEDVSETPGAAQVFPISRTVARFNDLSRANRFTSACSATIFRDETLGPEFYGNSFVCEPVHNLVHREILRPEGTTFRSRKPDDEARREFLASRDGWFRPSMVRTGPDGALWIADMYRLVIEHPEWIPKDWQAKLDLRAGSDKGRLYRVFPTQLGTFPIPKLADLGPKELVAKLETSNGTVRDLVLQQIVERFAGQSTRTKEVGQISDALHKLFRESSRPTARLAAMCAMSLLDDELDTLVLRAALEDQHPGVRRWALRLVNQDLLALDRKLQPAVSKAIGDKDATVRLQALCTLGNLPGASGTLASGILGCLDEPPLLRAAASSLNAKNIDGVTKSVVHIAIESEFPPTSIVQCLGDTAVALDARPALARLCRLIVSTETPAHRGEALVMLLDVLSRHGSSLDKLKAKHDDELRVEVTQLETMLGVERGIVGDPHASDEDRILGLALLGRSRAHQSYELKLLADLLKPQTSDDVQAAAIGAVGRFSDPAAADLLLSRWKSLAPARKAQVLDVCLARKEWIDRLLSAVEAKQVAAAEIDVTRSQQLLTHANKTVRETATRVLAGAVNVDRRRVVEEYQSALSLTGDVARGREVFTKSCGNCHKLGDVGHAVGPDLAALSDRRAESLLVSVLDPNRAVESKYLAYTAETADGLTFTGLLLSEGTSDVTLALADGRRQTVLRSELETFASTAKSFMPEGLEKDLPPQKLADVLAFVASTRAARKTFAGNTPQVVKPEALRGEFYLLPEHAEIYGSTLVFEPKFSNLGYWRSVDDRAEWELEVAKAGNYDVWLEYALPPGAGGEFIIETADARLRGRSESTGSWERYRTVSLGVLKLAAGRQRFTVRPDGPPQEALFDLKSLRIKPRE
ncbi:MAG: c-type cytochrome [Planctomycetes bacterium]|nr:c-type cytochrome [Planctomycetota bacterium]